MKQPPKTPKKEIEKAERLRQEYFNIRNEMEKVGKFTVHTMDEVLDEEFGKKGTPERDAFDSEVSDAIAAYQMGEAIKVARENANLTHGQLGERLGVKKQGFPRWKKDIILRWHL